MTDPTVPVASDGIDDDDALLRRLGAETWTTARGETVTWRHMTVRHLLAASAMIGRKAGDLKEVADMARRTRDARTLAAIVDHLQHADGVAFAMRLYAETRRRKGYDLVGPGAAETPLPRF